MTSFPLIINESGPSSSMMTFDSWRRHANPWSVWTRLATVPLIAAAFYARAWIGWWSLVPIAMVTVWLWLNVRVFAPTKHTSRWESRAIFGEWLWINRKRFDLPQDLRRTTNAPLAASLAAAAVCAYGVIALEPFSTIVGSAGIVAGQIWFLSVLAALFDGAADRISGDAPWK